MNSSPLQNLSPVQLEKLRSSLRSGTLAHGLGRDAIRKTLPGAPPELLDQFARLESENWTPGQLAFLVDQVLQAKISPPRFSDLVTVAMSGPDHPAVHLRDTAAVFRELVERTEEELILVSYAIYNGKELFAPVVARQNQFPKIKLHLFLDIPRKRGDTTEATQIIARYRHLFLRDQWPGDTPPTLYHFVPSLESDPKQRASMHAKIVVSDRSRIFITSANLTSAAHHKNLETGLIIHNPQTAETIADHLFGLAENGNFRIF